MPLSCEMTSITALQIEKICQSAINFKTKSFQKTSIQDKYPVSEQTNLTHQEGWLRFGGIT
jgi:hypothetical protein